MLARTAEGRTTATIAWYRARLDRFAAYCHEAPAAEISSETVRTFLILVKAGREQAVSDGYVDSYRRALSALFTWSVVEEILERSPMDRVHRYKSDRRELAVLEPIHVLQLLATQPTSTFEGMRNRAMMATLYDTGIRVGELVRISIADVDLAGGTIKVHGKGRCDRRVPISRKLRAVLWTYSTAVRPRDALTPRLFTSAEGEALSENSINQWMRRAGRHAGISGIRVSPHTWRHSFATAYLRNGGNQFALQTILGHATSDMTRRYVHLAAGDVAAQHAIASPLERIAQ